ncbi:response regulator transcription factor [Candidatus Halobeggiatoa sp. HSG11]|nr:response regulator transcription factor [Candidatus Halobeggiatoa sp. HSG11]
MIPQTILIIEDEERIAHWVQSYFRRAGFQTQVARNGHTGLDMVWKEKPDLIVLDLMLPGLDGWALCKQVRRNSDVPIIMLTARDAQQDRVSGLEMGADDYVVKPFDLEELVARTRAVLRRVAGTIAEQLTVGELSIHLGTNTCIVRGTTVSLTRTQLALMTAFMRHPNQILNRDQLLDIAFNNDFEGFDRSIDAHIRRLRHKIEPNPSQPQYILTVYGLGYKFVT